MEEVSHVISLFFINMFERKKGIIVRCDLCERPLGLPPDAVILPMNGWERGKGLASLFGEIGLGEQVQISETLSETRMHSLLGSIATATSLSNMHVVPLSLLVGGIVGLTIGILFGMFIHGKGRIEMIGFVAGALLGGAIDAVVRAHRLALKKIRSACTKYHVDLGALERVSARYPRRVRMAVNDVYSEALLSRDT